MTLRSRISQVAAAFRGNPLDNLAIPLNSAAAWITDLFSGGPTSAGVAVNEQTAMQLGMVYCCVNVIASDVSSLTLKVYEAIGNGRRAAENSDLYQLLAVEPNPEMTPATFFATWVGCAVLGGNGYAEIQWDGAKPVALWPRNPRFVRPVRAKGTERLTNGSTPVNGDLVYEVSDTGALRIIAAKDMLHLPGLSMDGVVGLSPINAAKQTIGTAIASEKFGAGFFGRGSRPSGILTGPVDEKDPTKRAAARDSWEAANSGENQGRTAVMPGGWAWTAIGISPGEAQFLETQQYTRTQIAALFRLPPHLVGDTSRLSNGNHESVALEYIKFSLRPWLVRIEQEVQRKLMPRIGRTAGKYTVSFDLTELERVDFAALMNGFAVGKQWGFYNTNEVRKKLGDNPIGPEGDIYLVPLNMVPMKGLLNAGDDDQGGGGDGGDEGGDGGQPAGNGGRNQRMLLDRIGHAYGGLFRDAHGRLANRSKRDADAVAQIFGPVLEAIASEARGQAQQIFRFDKDADLGAEKILREVRRALEKRSADWTDATAEVDASADLARTVRAITLGIFREAGSNVALAA